MDNKVYNYKDFVNERYNDMDDEISYEKTYKVYKMILDKILDKYRDNVTTIKISTSELPISNENACIDISLYTDNKNINIDNFIEDLRNFTTDKEFDLAYLKTPSLRKNDNTTISKFRYVTSWVIAKPDTYIYMDKVYTKY
jgi:hypothetical protein